MSAVIYQALNPSRKISAQHIVLISLLAITIFGLSLSFRARDLGDTSLDLQNGIKLFIWLVISALCLFNIRKIIPLLCSPSGLSLSFLSVMALASTAWSEKPLYTLACAIGFSAYGGFAALCLRDMTESDFYKVIQYLLLAFVALGISGALVVPDIAWQPPSVEETQFRLQGFAANSNNFGRMAALLTLMGMGALKRNQAISINALLSMSVGLAGLLLSGSRTGLVAATLAAGLVAFRFFHHRLIVFMGLMAMLAIVLFFTTYGVSFNSLFKGMSRTGLESEILTLTGRTDLWGAAWALISERPFFGWGFNGTEERLSLMMGPDFYGMPVNPHQMILHLALGLGLIGVVPALTFIFYRLKTFILNPQAVNDLLALFILINGMAEVDLFGTPLFTNIIFFRIILKDGVLKRQTP